MYIPVSLIFHINSEHNRASHPLERSGCGARLVKKVHGTAVQPINSTSSSTSPLPPLQSHSHFHSRTKSRIYLRYDLNQPRYILQSTYYCQSSETELGFCWITSYFTPHVSSHVTTLDLLWLVHCTLYSGASS